MKLFARLMLPIGVFYLILAVGYHGYLVIIGEWSPLQVVSAIFAIPIALYLIWQGRQWRRDARFR